MEMFRKLSAALILLLIIPALFVSVFALGFDAEKIYDSVFVIYSGNSLGSGFAIGENCIISNAHVVGNKKRVKIKTYSGDSYEAYVIAIDEELDIAVLSAGEQSFAYLKAADYNDLAIGEDIYAIGAPNSMAYTITKGILSAKDRAMGKNKYLQTDAAINTGNSGGPLLNDSGEVIGVNTMKIANSDGISLSIPMTTVCEFLKASGLSVDDSGNVTGRVGDGNMPVREDDSTAETEGEASREPAHKINLSVLLSVVIFFALTACVVIFIFYRKNKTKLKKYDPQERTDFDIDIWE